MLKELRFPHSLGLLYSAFTYFTGFKVNSGEYKLMGLAPYGEPIYKDRMLEKLLDLKADGSFRMDMSYFGYCDSDVMTSKKMDDLFGGPPRRAETAITQREMDIAASIQAVTEEIVLRIARYAHELTGVAQPDDGRRRRAQLRRQRAGAARGPLRPGLDPARGGRRGRCARCRALHLARAARQSADREGRGLPVRLAARAELHERRDPRLPRLRRGGLPLPRRTTTS